MNILAAAVHSQLSSGFPSHHRWLLQGCILWGPLPDVILSGQWSALKQLTELQLTGWKSLHQEGGPSAGALHFLFRHLQRAGFQVGACRGLVQAQWLWQREVLGQQR